MENNEINLMKHCAQVYFTTNGLLLFHCVLCESQTLTNIQGLCRHLKDKHKNILIELKAKQNTKIEKYTVESLENEIDIIEYDRIDEEDNLDNVEDKSLEADIEEHEFSDNEVEQFIVEDVDTNTRAEDQDTTLVYGDIENVLDFCEDIEQNKSFDENFGESTTETNHKIEDTSQTSGDSIVAARPELGSYYLSRSKVTDEYQCPVCDRSFTKKGILSHHLRRHKEPELECDHCNKKFHTKTELTHHKLRINGIKPYMCTDCGRQYSTSGALTQHMKHHLNIRNAECDICGKRFYGRGQLKHHYVVHTRERKFSCKICDAKFARQKTLSIHMKIHANKREYKCKVCDADFNQLPGLHVHMRSKHKDIIRPNEDISH